MRKSLLILGAALLLALSGCSMVDSVVSATMDKSVAAGTDTWGGGFEGSVAQLEQPVPSISGWFGRRRTWYVSIKTPETGYAAAEVVKASHAPITVSASATGAEVSDK